MKKQRIVQICIALLAAVFVLGFFSCDSGGGDKKSDDITITFDTNGGVPATIPAVPLKKGQALGDKLPAEATKAGHTPDGWFINLTDTVKVTSTTIFEKSTKLTARFTPVNTDTDAVVTLDANGGSLGTMSSSFTVTKGTALGAKFPGAPTPPTTPANQAFDKWVNAATNAEVTAATVISADITLKAIYFTLAADMVQVNFSLGGQAGTPPQSVTILKGTSLGVNFPDDPQAAGQLFTGWFDNNTNTQYLATTPVNATVTLTAHWSAAQNTDARLSSVMFGTEVAILGAESAVLASTPAGSVTLLSTSAVITARTVAATANIEYWLDQGATGDLPTTSDWWADADDTFADGDILWIKVVNSTNTLYYKIVITVLTPATLNAVSIDGVTVVMRTPGTTAARAATADVLLTKKIGDQGAGIAIVATSGEATALVKWAKGTSNPTTYTAIDATTTAVFAAGELLYFQVTSDEGAVIYYKVRITFQNEGVIKYGTVTINNATKYIDPKWDDPSLDTYYINRYFPDDTSKVPETEATIAKAKALWDEEGLYIYLSVIDYDISEVDNEHESDSFELFVNEAYPNKIYGQGGSQYRVAANGQISGEGGSPAALNAHNTPAGSKVSAWLTDDVDGTGEPGYIVIMQAPWRLRSRFFDSTTYRNDWDFGFELQVNCAAETGTRYGCKVWNNVAHSNYQNANDYGVAKLIGQSGDLIYPPLAPTFTTSPKSAPYNEGVSVTLKAEASTIDEGAVTYQWYKSTVSATDAGSIISGATSANYTFTTPAVDTWYYVIATNTIGTKTATATSSRAKLTITDIPMVAKFTLAERTPVFEFNAADGASFGEYSSVTIELYMDAANNALSTRAVRLMGCYAPADLNATVDGYPYIGWAGGAYYDELSASWAAYPGAKADEWYTITYKLNNINGSGAPAPNGTMAPDRVPAPDATGPFLFGVGIAGAANGAKVQYIKNVTMVHGTDPSKNVSGDFFGFCGYTNDGDAGSWEYAADPSSGASLDKDFVLDFTADPKVSPATARYASAIKIDLGSDFDITKYAKFTFELKIFEADGTTEIEPANGIAQMKWRDKDEVLCAGAGAQWRWDLGNIGNGLSANTNANIPVYLKEIGQMHTEAQAPNPSAGATVEFGPVTPLQILDFESARDPANGGNIVIKIYKISFFLPE